MQVTVTHCSSYDVAVYGLNNHLDHKYSVLPVGAIPIYKKYEPKMGNITFDILWCLFNLLNYPHNVTPLEYNMTPYSSKLYFKSQLKSVSQAHKFKF